GVRPQNRPKWGLTPHLERARKRAGVVGVPARLCYPSFLGVPKPLLTRRNALLAAAPLAATPVLAGIARGAHTGAPVGVEHRGHGVAAAAAPGGPSGHAAMIREGAPAVGGPNDLDRLLYPPPAVPSHHRRGGGDER